jgi:lipopolysaccharide export system permease protein
MRRTLFRYLLVEQAVPFFVSLFVLTVVIFLGRSLHYSKLLFATDSGLADFGKLLFYSLPYLFAFTIPMAALIAVLVAFSRLSHDNEITAMKAAGISFYQMMPPVAVVTGCAWLVTTAITQFMLPPSNIALESMLLEMAHSRVQFGLKERVFNNQVEDLVFFSNSISPDGRRLQGIFISDERDRKLRRTIVAEEGYILPHPDRERITFRLFRGEIMRVDKDMRSVQTVKFQNYDFNVNLRSMALGGKSFRKDKQHMSIFELREALASVEAGSRRRIELLLEWHWRLSLPFACIVLGLLAAPLSVQTGSASRLTGVVIGLILFLLYYIFISAAHALAEDGDYPPAIGLWLPNVVFGILAIFMWIKTARESPLRVITIFRRMGASVISRFGARQRCELP